MIFNRNKRIYLDFASATPISAKVAKVLKHNLPLYANPDSLYKDGRKVQKIIDDARTTVARILHCHSDEVVFTSGGTESNNLALMGLILDFKSKHPDITPHIVVSSIEHSSILEMCESCLCAGVEFTVVQVSHDGLISPRDIRDALKSNTIAVSVMYANNEVGTIEPIREIAKVIRRFKNDNPSMYGNVYPVFHTDASQAPNYLSLDVLKLGVDMMTLDGGKIYGPKGTGCLYKSSTISLAPLQVGGGQEMGLRAGTSNILAITGFATALEETVYLRERESERLSKLQKYFFSRLLEISQVAVNGSLTERLPNNINVCFDGVDAEYLVYLLDSCGVSVSSASTCMNNKEDSYSYVVKNLDTSRGCEYSSLRFTMGRTTTKSDIDKAIKALYKSLAIVRG